MYWECTNSMLPSIVLKTIWFNLTMLSLIVEFYQILGFKFSKSFCFKSTRPENWRYWWKQGVCVNFRTNRIHQIQPQTQIQGKYNENSPLFLIFYKIFFTRWWKGSPFFNRLRPTACCIRGRTHKLYQKDFLYKYVLPSSYIPFHTYCLVPISPFIYAT